MCRLDTGADTASAVFTSITHLRFDPHKKHRVKRLRRRSR